MNKPAKPSGFLWVLPEARNVVCAALLGDQWPQAKAALQELSSAARKVLKALRRDHSNVDPILSEKLREAEIKANLFVAEGMAWLDDKSASGQLPQYHLETDGSAVRVAAAPIPPTFSEPLDRYFYRSRPTPKTGVLVYGPRPPLGASHPRLSRDRPP